MGCTVEKMVGTERIWTVRVSGGDPCSIKDGFGIVQDHDGYLSVWKVRSDLSLLTTIIAALKDNGCAVEYYEDSQTADQKAERLRMLGVQKEGFVFKTERCPTCALFDPHTEGTCGAEDWEQSFLDALLEQNSKAQTDFEECPVRARR